MRKILGIVIIVFFAISTRAQEINYGIKGGYNYTGFYSGESDDFSSRNL